MSGLLILAGGALLAGASPAEAQLSVDLRLAWHWDDGGWQPEHYRRSHSEPVYIPAPPPVRRAVPRRAPLPALRIPPGHLPPPGTCRLWVIGRPPGHQPPPTSCERLFRFHRQPGVVILANPRSYGAAWGLAPGWRDHEWRDRDRRSYRDERGWDRDDRRRGPERDGRRGRGNGRRGG